MRNILSGLTLAIMLLGTCAAVADEIDDAGKLPFVEGRSVLEALLAKASSQGDGDAQRRIHEHLAGGYLQVGDAEGALVSFEAAIGLAPKHELLRIRYAEVLLGVARANIASGALGRRVHPFLRDAVDALKELPLARRAGRSEATRARLVQSLVEARFLLREFDEALAAIESADPDTLPKGNQSAVRDLEGRLKYARGAFDQAAGAFLAAGNPIAAASAYDAARMPEKSIPLYAAAIRAAPNRTDTLARALASVRFHKAHAALLDALRGVEIPEGPDGIPFLRARAELAEGCGRIPEALKLLQDAAQRDERDPSALVAVARLRGIQALSGDAVSEDLLDSCAEAYIAALERDGDSEAAAAGLSWLASQDYGRLWRAWRNPRVRTRCLRVQEALARAVPDDAWAWGNLANTLRVLGRTEDALAAYAKAREANPYDPGIRSDEGLALSAAGRAAEALAAYEGSLQLDGGHLAGRQNGARALYLLGRDAAAAAHLGAAARTARAIGRSPGTYRFLLDRTWRAGRRSDLR